jgi:predicted ATPase/DNA-binding SARP family transcriptional activator
MSTAPCHIQVFGTITVSRDDKVISAFRSRQTARVLACLACRPRREFSREELVESFWPGSDPPAGRNSLNVSLSSLRKTLGESLILPVNITGKHHVRIDDSLVTTDYAQFKSLLRSIIHNSPAESQITTYTSALDLYKGELAPGLDDDWTLGERQVVSEQFLTAIRRLARLLIGSNRHNEALTYLRQAVRADPFREDIRRLTLQLLCAIGRRSEALTEYSNFVDLLRREMNIAPSEKTAELINKLVYAQPLASDAVRAIVKGPLGSRNATRRERPIATSNRERSPLFGRDDTVLEISVLLRSSNVRLVSLTGIGGVGKTRLAHAASDTLADQFGSSRHHVLLADVTESRFLEQAIVRSLNIRTDSRMNAHAQIIAALKDKPVLLVLDNLEQLLPSAASVVRALLDDLPMMKCLITTRQRINLSAEREYPVMPLQTPSLSGAAHRLLEFPIMQLFMHSAEIFSPGFEITADNCSDLAAICHHLEGLPLATEMAAAWLRVLTPKEILSRLSPTLDLLVCRDVDSPPRHASVRHTLDCSYDQLTDSHKRTFARLSVFRGGWTAAAADYVTAVTTSVSDLMDLRDRSLVSIMLETQPSRLFYLDIVREYAEERLTASGEETEVRIAHAQFFLNLVEDAQARFNSADSVCGLETVDCEYGNITEALRWTLKGGSPEHGVRLTASMWPYWLRRGCISEGIEWLDRADLLAVDLPDSLRARIKLGAGNMRITAGDYIAAGQLVDHALLLVQRANDESLEAEVQNALGNLAFVNGDWAAAQAGYERALTAYKCMHQVSEEARVLSNLANVAVRTGDLDTAIQRFDDALQILRAGADSHTLASVMVNSVSPLLAGNILETAGKRLVECIELSHRAGYPRVLAHCFEGTATIALRQSRWGDSATMFSVAAAIRRRIGAPLPNSHRSAYDNDYACLRMQLGDEGYEKAWQIGSKMSDKIAVEFCIRGTDRTAIVSTEQATLSHRT